MTNKLDKEIDLKLTIAESVVLADLISKMERFEDKLTEEEKRALWNLECVLEKTLTETLIGNYSETLEQSKQHLRPIDE
jgi:hypothetical protein